MKLSKEEHDTLVAILEYALDLISNKMCNDFNLKETMPSYEDRRALIKESFDLMFAPDEFEEYAEGNDFSIVTDWVVATTLLNKIGVKVDV